MRLSSNHNRNCQLLVEEMKIQHVHHTNAKHDRTDDGTEDEGKPHKHTKYCHHSDGI